MAFRMKGFSQHKTADLTKKQTGPRAVKKQVKQNDDVPLSPGYEDPIKIQRLQREGLTPDSQKFHKKAKANTAKAKAKRLLDYVNPKPKKSTTTKHGQLNDAEAEYETDKKLYEKSKKSSPNKQKPKRSKKSKSTHKVHSKSGKVEKMGLGGTKVTSNKKQFNFGGSPAKSVTDSVNRGNTDAKKVKIVKEKKTVDVKDDKGKVVIKNLPKNKKIEEAQKNEKKHTLKDKTAEQIKAMKKNAHPFVKTISGFVDSVKGAKTGQNKA
tara:strand:+ start:339 stop:1136 length:798 start_codon:yes stop_codon:yes gene_type:complete